MNRTAILAAIGAVAIAGGTAVAATRPADRPVPLIAAGASAQDDETTTTTEVDEPTTTSSTTTEPEATTTTSTTEAPTTTTSTEAPPPPPTTTTIASVDRLNIRCWGDGDKTGTKPGDGSTGAWVYCEFNGVHPRASAISLTRDGETIARTDDTNVTSYKDHEVRPGATYSYQVHSHTADGSVLQSSEAVRATAGGTAYDGPLALRCAGSGDGKSGEKPGTGTYVQCEWKGVPERAAYVKLVRDGTPINRSDDAGSGSYLDREVWPDERYTYQVHAYAADDTLLASSDAVTVTPGGGGEGS